LIIVKNQIFSFNILTKNETSKEKENGNDGTMTPKNDINVNALLGEARGRIANSLKRIRTLGPSVKNAEKADKETNRKIVG